MKAIAATLAVLTLAACHPQCYDRESCFIADQNARNRGLALTAIGASMLQPQPNVYVVRRGHGW